MSLITITSSFGSGGDEIAWRVAEELGFEVYDDQRLQEEAVKMGISERELKSLNEKAPGLFDRLLSSRPAVYRDLLASVVYEAARHGKGVFIGHGAQFFLQSFDCALHVRIHASETVRVEKLVADQGVRPEAAEKNIRRIDKRLAAFTAFSFQKDWNDPSLYDLMINLDKLGAEWAAKMIIELARSEEIKECSLNALESMEKWSLQRKINAAILENHLSTTTIVVEIEEKGSVHLGGWTRTEEEMERLLTLVKGVTGVSEVISDVFVMASRV